MKLKIVHKITLLMVGILALSIVGLTLMSSSKSAGYLTDQAKVDLAHLTSMARGLSASRLM
jgi:preprotein translocase subunit SecG